MLSIKKISFILLSTCSLMLSSCGSSNNKLLNEKEVDKSSFLSAIESTKENTYEICDVVGYEIENDITSGWHDDYELVFFYDKQTGWYPQKKVDFQILKVNQSIVEGLISWANRLDGADKLHYYVASNGYRLACDYSFNMAEQNGSLLMNYSWNEFGYPLHQELLLKIYEKTNGYYQNIYLDYTYRN